LRDLPDGVRLFPSPSLVLLQVSAALRRLLSLPSQALPVSLVAEAVSYLATPRLGHF
jgi:hypothetical protein